VRPSLLLAPGSGAPDVGVDVVAVCVKAVKHGEQPLVVLPSFTVSEPFGEGVGDRGEELAVRVSAVSVR
jgi:hypothetical protein